MLISKFIRCCFPWRLLLYVYICMSACVSNYGFIVHVKISALLNCFIIAFVIGSL